MSYTDEALKFVAGQAETAAGLRLVVDDSLGKKRLFVVGRDGNVSEYRPNDGARYTIDVHTLTAVVDYIVKTEERADAQLIVQVVDENKVVVFGELDSYGNRETLLVANALHPQFPFGQFIDAEKAVIALQAQFVQTDNTKLLLSFVGNWSESTVQTAQDDGVSQTTTVRSGVATVAKGTAPNPIVLRPYRTFNEVEQPDSEFIFRLHEGMKVGLFEGDGQKWRNEAISNVASFLSEALSDLSDRVTVLA